MIAHLELIRQSFADQFEPEGDGFLHRKHSKAAPIRVSAAEHDRFVATFVRRLQYLHWTTIAGIFAVSFALTVLSTRSSGIATWLIPLAALSMFVAAYLWMWNAPARELRERLPVGEPRSRDDVSRLA